jgi:hypothetical protein
MIIRKLRVGMQVAASGSLWRIGPKWHKSGGVLPTAATLEVSMRNLTLKLIDYCGITSSKRQAENRIELQFVGHDVAESMLSGSNVV